MTPTRKRYRPKTPPQITRDRMHSLVGKSITDALLHDPNRTHYPDATVEWIISHLLEVIANNEPPRP